MANSNYPRGTIASPGLTAGTCLRKDFGMINELVPTPDLMLSAWKVNEYIPYHIVETALNKTELYGKQIAVLGYTYKKNSDDTRDSLVPKLIRYIERQTPSNITVCEPHIKSDAIGEYLNVDMPKCLESAEVIFIAVNHDCFSDPAAFRGMAQPGAWVIDVWNCLGTGHIVQRI